jgi:effector-binding domain-containing protein
MRILKYLFLLLLLSLVALTIFVATLKGEFTVERSRIIHSQKSIIFSYVNDSKNWKEWNSWAVEDSLIDIKYYQNGDFSWSGKEFNGDIETLKCVLNDSISQKMNFNGNSSQITMRFKDTLKGTKISWKTTVKMGFFNKIRATLNGNIVNEVVLMLDKSLANLDRKLDYEINTYTVKLNGDSLKPECFYLEQTFTSEFSKVRKNSEIVFHKITTFCKENKITISGKPFLIYHTYDTEKKLTKISICIPIKEEIYITEGSEFLCKKLRSQPIIKVTMTGDYSHLNMALDKANSYIREKRYIKNTVYSHFEVFITDKSKTNIPSKWITEIQIPVHPKGISSLQTISQETAKDSIPNVPKIEEENNSEPK